VGDEYLVSPHRRNRRKPVKVIRFFIVLAALAGPARADSAKTKPELLEAETAAWNAAKPVFEKACANCHTTGGKRATKKTLGHFAFDSYPPTGHHAGTIGATVRDVLGLGKKKATMPSGKPGSVKGGDLALIKTWVDAWLAAERGGAHPPASTHHH
jgi:hypothetical protein